MSEASLTKEREEKLKRLERLEKLETQEKASYGGPVMGTIRAGLQGLSMGTSDEATAGVRAAYEWLVNDKDFNKEYARRVANERRRMKAFQEENPYLAYGAEIVGALPTALIPFAGQARAAGLGARIAQSALRAGAEGFAYGYGSAEGGEGPIREQIKRRLRQGGEAGLVAAPIGAAAPIVGNLAGNITRRAKAGRAARRLRMNKDTLQAMADIAQADDLAQRGAENIRRGGREAMLIDAGRAGKGFVDEAIQTSPRAANKALMAVDDRATRAAAKIRNSLDDVMGVPEGVKRTERALREGTEVARDATYRAAYSKPINYATEAGQRLEQLVKNRVPESAIKQANALMRAEGERSSQILFQIADDGTVTFRRLPDVRQLDYITRGLNDVAKNTQGQGAAGGMTNLGRVYKNLAREIRDILRNHVDEYDVALKTSASPIQAREALQLGETVLRPSTSMDEVAEEIIGMPEGQLAYVKQGIRSYLDDIMANVKRTTAEPNVEVREGLKALTDLSSRASREKLRMVLGDEATERLLKQIDEAASAYNLRASVFDNSATAGRLAAKRLKEKYTEGGFTDQLSRGRVVPATEKLVQGITGESDLAAQRALNELNEEGVDILLGTRGEDAVRLGQRLYNYGTSIDPAAERARRMAERLYRRGAAVGPAIADPDPAFLGNR